MMALNKTCPDDISVIVVADGIEKIDESVVDYFEEALRVDDYYIDNQNFDWFEWFRKNSHNPDEKGQDVRHALFSD